MRVIVFIALLALALANYVGPAAAPVAPATGGGDGGGGRLIGGDVWNRMKQQVEERVKEEIRAARPVEVVAPAGVCGVPASGTGAVRSRPECEKLSHNFCGSQVTSSFTTCRDVFVRVCSSQETFPDAESCLRKHCDSVQGDQWHNTAEKQRDCRQGAKGKQGGVGALCAARVCAEAPAAPEPKAPEPKAPEPKTPSPRPKAATPKAASKAATPKAAPKEKTPKAPVPTAATVAVEPPAAAIDACFSFDSLSQLVAKVTDSLESNLVHFANVASFPCLPESEAQKEAEAPVKVVIVTPPVPPPVVEVPQSAPSKYQLNADVKKAEDAKKAAQKTAEDAKAAKGTSKSEAKAKAAAAAKAVAEKAAGKVASDEATREAVKMAANSDPLSNAAGGSPAAAALAGAVAGTPSSTASGSSSSGSSSSGSSDGKGGKGGKDGKESKELSHEELVALSTRMIEELSAFPFGKDVDFYRTECNKGRGRARLACDATFRRVAKDDLDALLEAKAFGWTLKMPKPMPEKHGDYEVGDPFKVPESGLKKQVKALKEMHAERFAEEAAAAAAAKAAADRAIAEQAARVKAAADAEAAALAAGKTAAEAAAAAAEAAAKLKAEQDAKLAAEAAAAAAAAEAAFQGAPKITAGPSNTVAGPDGRALYWMKGESEGGIQCVDACRGFWTLAQTNWRVARTGVACQTTRTFLRPDGDRQLSFCGKPLYQFVNDAAPGQTSGTVNPEFVPVRPSDVF